jgi:hypothetical protein
MESLGCLLELLLTPLVDFLVRLILLLVVLIVATPGVLIGALFGSEAYLQNVRNGYQSVIEFWAGLG